MTLMDDEADLSALYDRAVFEFMAGGSSRRDAELVSVLQLHRVTTQLSAQGVHAAGYWVETTTDADGWYVEEYIDADGDHRQLSHPAWLIGGALPVDVIRVNVLSLSRHRNRSWVDARLLATYVRRELATFRIGRG